MPIRHGVGAALVLLLLVAAVLTALALLDPGTPPGEAPPVAAGPQPSEPARPAPGADRAVLAGRVLDGLGNPLRGCTVIAQELQPLAASLDDLGAPAFVHRTGSDGTFHMELPAGVPLVAVTEHGDLPPVVLPGPFLLREGQVMDRGDIVLRARPGLVIELQSSLRAPLAGARVEIDPLLEDPRLPDRIAAARHRVARTDSAGRATLRALPPGDYRITARAAGHATAQRPYRTGRGATADRVQMRLGPSTELRCRIQAPDGQPIAGAEIVAEPLAGGVPEKAITGPLGACVLEGLPAGPLRLRARVPGYGDLELEPAPAHSVVLELPGGDVLRGTVVGPERQPVTGARVELHTDSAPLAMGRGRVFRPWTTTRSDGSFTILGLPTGSFSVTVSSQGFSPGVVGPLSTDAPPTTVVLAPTGRLSGKVMDAGGRPLRDASIELLDPEMDGTPFAELRAQLDPGQRLPRARSETGGRFLLRDVPAGRWRLRLSAPDHAPRVVGPLVVGAGDSLDLGVQQLATGSWIHGHAFDRNGVPTPRALVCADPSGETATGNPGATAFTDRHGAFSLGPLAAGSYQVFYYFPEGQTAAEAEGSRAATQWNVELRPGEESTRDLTPR